MKQVVKENLDPDLKINTSFVVREGQLSKKILKLASEKSADIILVGKKTTISGSGVITQRLARRASCSLLIVPENSSPKVKRFLFQVIFLIIPKMHLKKPLKLLKKMEANQISFAKMYTQSLPVTILQVKPMKSLVKLCSCMLR